MPGWTACWASCMAPTPSRGEAAVANVREVTGGCHCGAVRFEATVDMDQTLLCNCSHCEKKGFILAFTSRDSFNLLQGEDRLSEYRFNKKQLAHRFCSTCGTQAFAFGIGPDGSEMAAINLRCVDGLDLATLHPEHFDGRSM